jgi:hypothetical protein
VIRSMKVWLGVRFEHGSSAIALSDCRLVGCSYSKLLMCIQALIQYDPEFHRSISQVRTGSLSVILRMDGSR